MHFVSTLPSLFERNANRTNNAIFSGFISLLSLFLCLSTVSVSHMHSLSAYFFPGVKCEECSRGTATCSCNKCETAYCSACFERVCMHQ